MARLAPPHERRVLRVRHARRRTMHGFSPQSALRPDRLCEVLIAPNGMCPTRSPRFASRSPERPLHVGSQGAHVAVTLSIFRRPTGWIHPTQLDAVVLGAQPCPHAHRIRHGVDILRIGPMVCQPTADRRSVARVISPGRIFQPRFRVHSPRWGKPLPSSRSFSLRSLLAAVRPRRRRTRARRGRSLRVRAWAVDREFKPVSRTEPMARASVRAPTRRPTFAPQPKAAWMQVHRPTSAFNQTPVGWTDHRPSTL